MCVRQHNRREHFYSVNFLTNHKTVILFYSVNTLCSVYILICHMSSQLLDVICNSSNVNSHKSNAIYYLSHVTFQISCVKCHLSHDNCQMSSVKYHLSSVKMNNCMGRLALENMWGINETAVSSRRLEDQPCQLRTTDQNFHKNSQR